jgi:hypothetical protein
MISYTLEEILLLEKALILKGMRTENYLDRRDRYCELKDEFDKKLQQLIQLTIETHKFNIPAKELTSKDHCIYCYGRFAGNITEGNILFLKDKINSIVDDYMHKVVENDSHLDIDKKRRKFVGRTWVETECCSD